MLKITKVATSNQEITLQLDGRVTGQWIELLRDSAESVLEEEMRLSLDLKNICFIDCEGLAVIKSLMGRGVRQINAPLFGSARLQKPIELHRAMPEQTRAAAEKRLNLIKDSCHEPSGNPHNPRPGRETEIP